VANVAILTQSQTRLSRVLYCLLT